MRRYGASGTLVAVVALLSLALYDCTSSEPLPRWAFLLGAFVIGAAWGAWTDRWSVDRAKPLVRRLRSLSPGQRVALVDGVERVWGLGGRRDQRPTRERLVEVGLVQATPRAAPLGPADGR